MKKILLILTGGTIGSKSENGTVNVDSEAAYGIVDMYYKKYGQDVEFEAVQPVNILSENIVPNIWVKLCKCIDSKDISQYRGIIICHGSDSLSFTSAFIGMVYGRLNIPVVLIASNYELGNEKSNGILNMRNAVLIIKKGISGVFTSYSNDCKKNDIYLATRIVESDPYRDRFRSFDGKVWGNICGESLEVRGSVTLDDLNNFKSVIKRSPVNLNKKVMLIRPYPGLDYDKISTEGISAVVHYLYHSATACVNGDETSIVKFIKRCKESNVKVYGASFKDREMLRAYKSGREIIEAGILPMFNISPEAAYVKAVLCENTDIDFNETIYFEEC